MSNDEHVHRESSGEELARILAKRSKPHRARSTSVLVAILLVLLGVLIGVPLGRASAPAPPEPAPVVQEGQ